MTSNRVDAGPIGEIAAERRRQIEGEGWSTAHDDEHTGEELAYAAACYASPVLETYQALWPWPPLWWKPSTRRRDLIKAAALIVAEIERLDRAARGASTKEVDRG